MGSLGSSDIAVDNSWEIHGKSMYTSWKIHVKSMETVLPFSGIHGKSMGIHRKFMENYSWNSWKPMEFMENSWKYPCKLHVKFMESSWKMIHGKFMEFREFSMK